MTQMGGLELRESGTRKDFLFLFFNDFFKHASFLFASFFSLRHVS